MRFRYPWTSDQSRACFRGRVTLARFSRTLIWRRTYWLPPHRNIGILNFRYVSFCRREVASRAHMERVFGYAQLKSPSTLRRSPQPVMLDSKMNLTRPNVSAASDARVCNRGKPWLTSNRSLLLNTLRNISELWAPHSLQKSKTVLNTTRSPIGVGILGL